MTNKQFESEKEYESRLCIIKSMLKSELITEDEYDKIDKILIKKYSPIFGELCR